MTVTVPLGKVGEFFFFFFFFGGGGREIIDKHFSCYSCHKVNLKGNVHDGKSKVSSNPSKTFSFFYLTVYGNYLLLLFHQILLFRLAFSLFSSFS